MPATPDSRSAKVVEPRETRRVPLKAHKIRAEAACNERSWSKLQNKNQGKQSLQIPIEPAGPLNSKPRDFPLARFSDAR